MSLQFSDLTNFKGIVQIYEKEIGATRTDISGNTDKLKEFTADVNLALDDYFELAIPASGTWQLDDSGHTDYPIIKANIVSGQNDYSFTTDGSGNLILDIYKVAIIPSAEATLYEEIYPIDVQKPQRDHTWFNGRWYNSNNLVSETTNTGVPIQYDKTANALFLDPTPSYSKTLGLKLYINREASYFTDSDTTKKPGVPGTHHKYFAIKPAFEFARRNSLANARALENEIAKMEKDIVEHFGKRSRDEKTVMRPRRINYI